MRELRNRNQFTIIKGDKLLANGKVIDYNYEINEKKRNTSEEGNIRNIK